MFQVSLDSLAVVLKRSLQPTNSISNTRDLFTNANLRFYSRPTESETLGCGPAICVLTNHPCDSDTHSCMRSMALRPQIIFSHLWAWSCLPVLLTSSTSSSLSISLKMFISSTSLFYLSFPVSIVFPKDPSFLVYRSHGITLPRDFLLHYRLILNLFRVVNVVAPKRSKNKMTLLKKAMGLKSFRNSSSFYLMSPPSPRPCPRLHGWSWMWASPCSESRERKMEEVQGEGLPFRQVTQNLLLTFPHIQLFTLCLRGVWSAMCPGRRKTWLNNELSILPLPTAVLSRIPSPSHSHCILSSLCKLWHDHILINNLL